MGYFLELAWVHFIKLTGKLIPIRLRYRFYLFFYNYQSSFFKGVHLTIPYYKKLNLKFSVNTKYLIDWNVFFFGYYEKDTNDILFEYIKPGQVVVEAGANNGTETLLLSRIVGEKGSVIAFEPVEHIYDTLNANLKLNGCTNVITEQLAVGERNQEVFFNVRPKTHCNQGMASQDNTLSAHDKVSIQQVSLDSWISKHAITSIDFIKMDIQGAEIDLLAGAESTIKKFHPVIFTEADSAFLSLDRLFDTLSTLGYVIYAIHPKGGLKRLAKNTLKDGNWLAKKK